MCYGRHATFAGHKRARHQRKKGQGLAPAASWRETCAINFWCCFRSWPDLFPAVSCPRMPPRAWRSQCAAYQDPGSNGWMIELPRDDRPRAVCRPSCCPAPCPACCRHHGNCARRRRCLGSSTASTLLVLLASCFSAGRALSWSDKLECRLSQSRRARVRARRFFALGVPLPADQDGGQRAATGLIIGVSDFMGVEFSLCSGGSWRLLEFHSDALVDHRRHSR